MDGNKLKIRRMKCFFFMWREEVLYRRDSNRNTQTQVENFVYGAIGSDEKTLGWYSGSASIGSK